jgi:hypothetical protein
MALVPIKIDRISKPPIGTPLRSDGHWSVQGLINSWTFNSGAGAEVIDSVTCKQAVLSSPATGWHPDGMYGNGSTTPRGLTISDSIPVLSAGTMIASCKIAMPVAVDVMAFGDYYLRLLATGMVRGQIRTNGIYAQIDTTATISEEVSSVAFAYYPVGSTASKIYVNGINRTSSVTAGSGGPEGNTGKNIGCQGGNLYSNILNGVIKIASRYDRVLSEAEVKSISENPWQIYEPETIWVTVEEAGQGISCSWFDI